MRVKKYLALIFAAILATTMLTACPWEEEEDKTDDAASGTTSGSSPAGEDGNSDPDEGDEGKEEGGEETEAEPQDYTFTVAVDTDDQEAPTNFYMQVDDGTVQSGTPKDGKCSFTVSLKPGQEYTYLFWADNATSAEEPESLTSVTYQTGTAAYAANKKGTPDAVKEAVALEPVTTKVTLTDSSNTLESITNEETLTITLQAASTYDVSSGSASNSIEQKITHTFGQSVSTDSAVFQLLNTLSRGNDKEICSFYTLVSITPGSSNEATITFRDLKMTTPLTKSQSETAVDLSQPKGAWTATAEYAKKKVKDYFYKENGDPEGTTSSYDGTQCFYLEEEKINDLEAVISDIFHENETLKIQNYAVFDKTLDGVYNFSIRKNDTGGTTFFYICENGQFVCGIAYGSNNTNNWTNFSVVSDKLKQTT